MRKQVAVLQAAEVQRKSMEEERRRLLHRVGERVKELTALHRTVRVLQDSTKPLAHVLNEIVALLPPAWQYPEVTEARIVFDGMVFTTANFKRTPWMQSAPLTTSHGRHGVIEVVYLKERPPEAEGPFLAEERHLIDSLADSVSSYLTRKHAEEALLSAHKRLQALSQQLMHVQEQERRQLAQDLHDEIGQALTALKMNLQTMERVLDTSGVAIPLSDSVAIIDKLLEHVRNVSLDLRPSLLDDLGLVPAVRWYVARQAERAGITAEVDADQSRVCLSPDMAVAGFRVVQEAVTNVLRHAKATRLHVSLRQSDRELELAVEDDGGGFHVPDALARAAKGHSLGLLGMQERVRALGGKISILSERGRGTKIIARIPLPSAVSHVQR